MKRKVFFPVIALAIIAAGLMSTNLVSAQDSTGANSLVAAIAQKFNLNQTDVQAVFDEEHAKREAEMKAAMEQRLNQAVADGKITEAQKQAIIAHFGEMKIKKFDKSEVQSMSEADIVKIREEKKTEMDAWLSQNGLTHELLQEVMGHKGFKGKMMFKMH